MDSLSTLDSRLGVCILPSVLSPEFLRNPFLFIAHRRSLYVQCHKMSPKYWVSSEDLSADSSLEESHEISRDRSGHDEEGKDKDDGLTTVEGSVSQNLNDGAVVRTGGTGVTLPKLPNLQPQQHATLFYLSLIEGRCRTQAANTINAGRDADNTISEDHPEVLSLAQHLFKEMRGDLVKAGLSACEQDVIICSADF